MTHRIFSDFMTIQKEFIQLEQVTFNNTLIIMDELLRVSPNYCSIKRVVFFRILPETRDGPGLVSMPLGPG